MTAHFSKAFTQQEAISEEAIDRVANILRSGRLHRYNSIGDEWSQASLLEQEYAQYQGSKYCVAVTSGGQALQLAMRSAGVKANDKVLTNAYTLAPVPGAIFAIGGIPILVEIDQNWHIDIQDLSQKAATSGAKFLLLSHMRGHIADMEAIAKVCAEFSIVLIEDCAHTMGAKWRGKMSGNFGIAGCFSTQTYKHLNSGEGGLITTNDDELAARAVVSSGSYMLYGRHGAIPPEAVFERVRLDSPNYSARIDNIRAALVRAQLPHIDHSISRWNRRYSALEAELKRAGNITVSNRAAHEEFVGSSLQFRLCDNSETEIVNFVRACAVRGVELKWFGASEPSAYTSRYDSWEYLGEIAALPQTLHVLASTCDIRIPLTFSEADCQLIGQIIVDEATNIPSR